jgi:hypothetical protein
MIVVAASAAIPHFTAEAAFTKIVYAMNGTVD